MSLIAFGRVLHKNFFMWCAMPSPMWVKHFPYFHTFWKKTKEQVQKTVAEETAPGLGDPDPDPKPICCPCLDSPSSSPMPYLFFSKTRNFERAESSLSICHSKYHIFCPLFGERRETHVHNQYSHTRRVCPTSSFINANQTALKFFRLHPAYIMWQFMLAHT